MENYSIHRRRAMLNMTSGMSAQESSGVAEMLRVADGRYMHGLQGPSALTNHQRRKRQRLA